MRENKTKAKLRSGEAVFSAFCNVNAPGMVEMLGYLGFDFVSIDGEHGPLDLETSEHMVRAADAAGITPPARVALNIATGVVPMFISGARAYIAESRKAVG